MNTATETTTATAAHHLPLNWCDACHRDDATLQGQLQDPELLPYNQCSACNRTCFLRRDETWVEHCPRKGTVLALHCFKKEWKLARQRVLIYPREAARPKRSKHASALYWTCFFGQHAPLELIRLLAYAAPEAIARPLYSSESGQWWLKTKFSPLQAVVCSAGTTLPNRLEMVRILLTAELEHYGTGMVLPSMVQKYHHAASSLSSSRTGTSCTSPVAYYPAHRLLVALDLAAEVVRAPVLKMLEARRTGDTTRASLLEHPTQRYRDFPAQWQVLCYLYRTLYYSAGYYPVSSSSSVDIPRESVHHNKPLLHALVGSRTRSACSDDIVRLAVAIYPDELKQPDEYGNLPLHIAASSQQQPKPAGKLEVDALLDRTGKCTRYTKLIDRTARPSVYKASLVRILVEAQGDAAATRNRAGRYPLHLALEAGKTLPGGVQELLASFPDATSEVDPVTGLFPFQLAATFCEETSQKSIHVQRLNVIYKVLRQDPAAVAFARR